MSQIPRATHVGEIKIGDLVLPCAVLGDGTRVFSETGMAKALGRTRGGSPSKRSVSKEAGVYLPVFMSAKNLQPFIDEGLKLGVSNPIRYRAREGFMAYGIKAAVIPEICTVFLKAREAGALLSNQEHIAERAEVIVRGLAHVGIIALVDEATGYQADRDRDALHRLLEAYVSKEFLPWTKEFPDEFYEEMFRLMGWQYSPPQVKRPKLVGALTSQLVYEKLPPGVLDELRQLNPVTEKGYRKKRHHQYLTADIGHPHLQSHVAVITALMRASSSWAGFRRLFGRAFPGRQIELDFGLEDEA
ncbi:MAG TPA: P63C domain-containing protein [Bacillota bacterium]